MQKYSKKMAKIIILAIFFVSIDRFFKIFALNYLADDKIAVFGGIFSLNLAKNYYIALSLPLSGQFLIVFVMFLIVILIYYWLDLIKKSEFLLAPCLTFIIFGAISNIIDRVKYGYVVDYLDLKYFTIFNFADVMIVGGFFLFFINSYIKKEGGGGR